MSVETKSEASQVPDIDRQSMEVDIACVGFGPATGGFLTTLTQAWTQNPADPAFESKVAPGMPLQVLCYERADDLAAGVSGVVTLARGIGASFPALNPAEIPMAANVTSERVLYLLDPIGVSRRSLPLRFADRLLRAVDELLRPRHKEPRLRTPMDSALPSEAWRSRPLHRPVQPVGRLATHGHRPRPDLARHPRRRPAPQRQSRHGVRLADQGVDKSGAPTDNFIPGMDIHAQLTVVGDGPVGAVGRALDQNRKRRAARLGAGDEVRDRTP